MSIKPILFSSPMVRAILVGRKTMTRRVLKPQPVFDSDGMWHWRDCQLMDGGLGFPASGIADHAPSQPGDILWVREMWRKTGVISAPFAYRADECPLTLVGEKNNSLQVQYSYRPSIHMPRDAARIFLRVTDVRIERLQKMPLYDVWSEGTPQMPGNVDADGAVGHEDFKYLWDSINAKRAGGAYAWDKNPWIWVISFERVDKPAGWPDRPSKEARNEAD